MRWIVLLAACNPLPPPPLVPTYATIAPDERGTTTAMIVVGLADQPLGGGGFGMALRVEHQQTDRTTLGVELTGGVQDGKVAYADGTLHRSTLLGVRGYGRFAASDNLGLTYGAGLVYLGTGALVGQLHAGGMFGANNDTFGTVAQVALALATPILHGEPYGSPPWGTGKPVVEPLRTNVFASFDIAGILSIGNHDRVALDAAIALPLVGSDALIALSAANAVR